MDLSIAICTYNRGNVLSGALKSLCNQTVRKDRFEVIVVDNASADNTKAVVNQYLASLNPVYGYEPRQGLSYARNYAVKLARAEYVAYIDDDIKLCPEWIERSLSVIKEIKPDILGGPILPFYNSEKPRWFFDEYETISWGNESHYLDGDEYLSGCNIIFKKDLLRRLGGFNTALGMKGKQLGYHEEGELIKRAKKVVADIKIYYHPAMTAYHLVPKYKMSVFWYIKRSFYLNKFSLIYSGGRELRGNRFWLILGVCYQVVAILLKAAIAILFRNRRKYKYFQNFFIERILYDFSRLFKLWLIIFQKSA